MLRGFGCLLVELMPPHRIVKQSASSPPTRAFLGQTTMTPTFEEAAGAAEVNLLFKDLPSDLRTQGNEAVARSSRSSPQAWQSLPELT
jgi:hypothetical protein